MVTLSRFVTEIEVGPDGSLRLLPGWVWRFEPARGEAGIHRRFAALTDASASRIGTFASTYGLLRLGAAQAYAASESGLRQLTMVMSHKLLDDVGVVRDWLQGGASEPPPDAVGDFLMLADTFDPLPASTLEALRRVVAGAQADEIEAVVGSADVDPAAYLSGMVATAEASRGRLFDRARDPGKLAVVLDIFEWIGRISGGLDEGPEEFAAMGGSAEVFRSLLVNLPEALAHPELAVERNIEAARTMAELALESVADWHVTAEIIQNWIGACRLVRQALTKGLEPNEKEELVGLYHQVTGADPSTLLSGAEIAERTQPLLLAQLEGELLRGGAWPIRRGAALGLYWRALIALRSELTEQGPLISCATVGCPGTFRLTRNRRFCGVCQTERRRKAVARHRMRAPQGC